MSKIKLPFPLRTRRQIPFFYDKSEAEFRQDSYEDFNQMVMRQMMVHLADVYWDRYPHQAVLDWILEQIDMENPTRIADIGCGVGRLIGELATTFPDSECWGIDYSYQLLRQAHDYWVGGKTLDLDEEKRGLEKIKIIGKTMPNVHFGLAKAEHLPFENASLDLICSSFVLDRFESPIQAMKEMYRVLQPEGRILLVSPLNFQKAAHWKQLFPMDQLLDQLKNIGFHIEKATDGIVVKEPLDKRGNYVHWTCLGISLRKK